MHDDDDQIRQLSQLPGKTEKTGKTGKAGRGRMKGIIFSRISKKAISHSPSKSQKQGCLCKTACFISL